MAKTNSPEVAKLGSWIWIDIPSVELPQHALFRRDFVLDSIPGDCILQVAANCSFQLYVNAHFFTCGPMPQVRAGTTISRYDISHLMEIGTNSIALHAICDYRPATSHRKHSPGIWLQLLGDGKHIVWTDSKWMAYPLGCYAVTDLPASPAESFVEMLDWRQFPAHWLDIMQQRFDAGEKTLAEDVHWGTPSRTWSLPASVKQSDADEREGCGYEPLSPKALLFRGTADLRNETLWVSFAEVFQNGWRPGLYVAETYVRSDAEAEYSLFCFSATPFRLFVNGDAVAERNVPPMQHRYSYPQLQNRERLRLEDTEVSADVTLRKGWNRILLVKWCDVPASGFTIIFGDMARGTLKVCRAPEETAQPGWSVAGPVRTPLQLVSRNFSLESLNRFFFHNDDDVYRDQAAFSLASAYTMEARPGKPSLPVALTENQMAVLDFGYTVYALPRIRVSSGNKDDVLDVVCGEHLLGHEVMALENGVRRNVSTLILGDCRQPIVWQLSERKGFRYVMLIARKAKTVITVQDVTAYVPAFDAQNRGTFKCSDNVLNAIWEAGVRTLDATLQGRFLDSPTKDQTQSLPDSMIQAQSAFFTHGGYRLSAESLCSFAQTQLETGEINSLAPSSYFQAIPDFTLLWPIWLQKHLMYTGDQTLGQQLQPVLDRLLDCYNSLATEPDGPLGNVEPALGNAPFLDLGEIDVNGISTGLNAIYCRALFAAAWIAEYIEMPELQKKYRNRAARVARHIRKLCWNETRHLFADCYRNAQPSPFFSWQSNVLAIYGGIAAPSEFQTIWNKLFAERPPYENFAQGDFNNPYFKYFILDDAYANGLTQWAFNFIRYYWGKMLEAGATTFWELFDPGNTPLYSRICSHCQGYAVAPNAFIISDILGIRPAEPGMSTIIFAPDLEDLQSCEATLPTPQGRLTVSWKLMAENVLETTIQANYPVDIVPVLSPKYASKAVFQVSDMVSILAEDNSAEEGE